jgi:phage terminase large subunit-like protein
MMPGGQSGFFMSGAKYPGMFGGVGASKTFTGLHKAIAVAEGYPGAYILITEPTARMIEDVLIPTLRQELGSVEGTAWTLQGSPGARDVVFSYTKSVFRLRSALLMSPDMLAGQSLAAFWMDEAALGDQERTFRNLQERLRQPGDYPHQGWVTSTPRGKNWCYDLWGPGHRPAFEGFHVKTKENPYLPQGYYEDLLDSFGDTPFARQELEGEFVTFQGLIYAMFNTSLHVQEPPKREEFVRVVAGVDFSGGTSPSVIQVYGRKASRHVAGLAEFYERGCPIEHLVEAAGDLMGKHRISRFYCDPSGRDEIEAMVKAGIPACPAPVKDVNLGIKLVSGLLSRGPGGEPGLTFSPSQVQQISEMYQYQWREQKTTGQFLDEPVKQNDHCLTAGTLVSTARGEVPIEQVSAGDYALTRQGYRRVVAQGMTNPAAEVATMRLSNGMRLTVTLGHPFWVEGRGFRPCNTLRYGDTMETVNEYRRLFPCQEALTGEQEPFGGKPTGLFRQIASFITSTATRLTTLWRTWNVCRQRNMPTGTGTKRESESYLSTLTWAVTRLLAGIGRQRVERGTGYMAALAGKGERLRHYVASIAALGMRRGLSVQLASAPTSASPPPVGAVARITRVGSVSIVGSNSRPTDIATNDAAPVYVLGITVCPDRQPVYNLTVEDTPEYFANGILVHNCCDASRYALTALVEPPASRPRIGKAGIRV